MSKSLTYKSAGVDTAKKGGVINRIIRLSKKTYEPRVIDLPWGFAGLFSLFPKAGKTSASVFTKNYKSPTLVACTDGVGTKLKLAFLLNKHDTIGIDLVAMSVNDLVVTGAEPLFFLDYISCGKVDETIIIDIVKGIVSGCQDANCTLLGGETAEMPSFYPPSEYDLAGFAVGLVDKHKIITGQNIKSGDTVIGLFSSGIHSNGYSLVRKIVLGKLSADKATTKLNKYIPNFSSTLGEELLKPTRIYARAVKKVQQNYRLKKALKGIAHITGGGLIENIPRILPRNLAIEIDTKSYKYPAIFSYLQEKGNVSTEEMYRVFNMGIGMVFVVTPYYARAIIRRLKQLKYEATVIGKVITNPSSNEQIIIK